MSATKGFLGSVLGFYTEGVTKYLFWLGAARGFFNRPSHVFRIPWSELWLRSLWVHKGYDAIMFFLL